MADTLRQAVTTWHSRSRMRFAEDLGRLFCNTNAFRNECAECVDRDLVNDLLDLVEPLSDLSDVNAYTEFVRKEVFPFETRCAFYFSGPFERFIIVHRSKVALERAGNVYPFLRDVSRRRGKIDRVAAALLSTIAVLVPATPFLEEICLFLFDVAQDAHARPLLGDAALLENLARRMSTESVHSILSVVQSSNMHDVPQAYPILRETVRMMHLIWRFVDTNPVFRECLAYVEECARNPAWRPLLVSHAVQMARFGWRECFGTFFALMLSGPSTELVLLLARGNKLASLVRAAYDIPNDSVDALSWAEVRFHLWRTWPSFVCSVMDFTDDTKPSTTLTCPITLEACVHPVVASDGRTYERNAIMQHMHVQGMSSPITKHQLAFELFVNYDAKNL
jgi:hypothetical protein